MLFRGRGALLLFFLCQGRNSMLSSPLLVATSCDAFPTRLHEKFCTEALPVYTVEGFNLVSVEYIYMPSFPLFGIASIDFAADDHADRSPGLAARRAGARALFWNSFTHIRPKYVHLLHGQLCGHISGVARPRCTGQSVVLFLHLPSHISRFGYRRPHPDKFPVLGPVKMNSALKWIDWRSQPNIRSNLPNVSVIIGLQPFLTSSRVPLHFLVTKLRRSAMGELHTPSRATASWRWWR